MREPENVDFLEAFVRLMEILGSWKLTSWRSDVPRRRSGKYGAVSLRITDRSHRWLSVSVRLKPDESLPQMIVRALNVLQARGDSTNLKEAAHRQSSRRPSRDVN